MVSGDRRLAQGATGDDGTYRFKVEGEIIGQGQYAVQVTSDPGLSYIRGSRSQPAIIKVGAFAGLGALWLGLAGGTGQPVALDAAVMPTGEARILFAIREWRKRPDRGTQRTDRRHRSDRHSGRRRTAVDEAFGAGRVARVPAPGAQPGCGSRLARRVRAGNASGFSRVNRR